MAKQTATEATAYIARMEKETKSKAARKRMAEINVNGFNGYTSNLTDEARKVWAEYLGTFK